MNQKTGRTSTPQQRKARHQWQGLVNRAEGKDFEERLDASFDWYRFQKRAAIKKTPEPMRVLRSLGDGQFVACFEKKAQPDYKGTLAGGRSVLLEAKYTSTERMHQSAVSDEQADEMDTHEAIGALCYVIFGFTSGKVYRFPWTMWKDMKRIFGRKYVMETDALLEDYRLRPSQSGILPLLEPGPEHHKEGQRQC